MPQIDLITLRQGPTVEWVSVNPVLELGEAGYEVDTNRVKIGDGLAPWTGLDYLNGTDAATVYETVAESLLAGTNTVIVTDPGARTVTISATTDTEAVRDAMAASLVAGANVTITADDAGNTITIAAAAGLDTEAVVDAVAAALVAGTGTTITYNDGAGTITVSSDGWPTAVKSTQPVAADYGKATIPTNAIWVVTT